MITEPSPTERLFFHALRGDANGVLADLRDGADANAVRIRSWMLPCLIAMKQEPGAETPPRT